MKTTVFTVLTTFLALGSAKPLCTHQANNQTISTTNSHGNHTITGATHNHNHNHNQTTGLASDHHHAHARAAPAFSGKMTYYAPGQGACGATNGAGDMVVAIPASVYGTYANPNASPMCQKTVTITCPGGGKTVKAAVRDRCAGCGGGDIDVSPAVFQVCGDLALGKMAVGWDVN